MNDYRKVHRTFAVSAAALLLAGTFGAYTGRANAEPASPVHTSISASVQASSTTLTPPLWSRTTDRFPAVVNGNTVYYQADSKLIAANVSTGKIRWTYATASYSPVLTLNGSVYAATSQGQIVKLSAASGKAVWTQEVPGKSANASDPYIPVDFRLSGTTLYLTDSTGVTQISAVNGKTIRTLPDVDTLPLGIYGNAWFGVSVSSGAYMRETLEAYNKKTGQRLWEVEGDHNQILGFRNGYLYTRYIPIAPDQSYASMIDKVDLKTGKIVKRFNYIPVDSIDEKGAEFTVMSGKCFYLIQRGDQSRKIQRIAVDAPSDTKPETIAELNGTIVAFDVVGNRIVALLDNGILNVFDRDTAKLRTTAAVPAERDSRLTLQSGKVLVQSGDTLSVVKVLSK